MSLRTALNTPRGRVVAALVLVGAAAAVYVSARGSFGPADAALAARDRLFVCAETNRSFRYRLSLGDSLPVPSPHSGKRTGYPAELCYWTADGQIREEPAAVLLNSYIGQAGPTFCPDCGRLVVPHNPPPRPGMAPPPVRDQYKPSMDGEPGDR